MEWNPGYASAHPTENISANHGSLFIASVSDTVDNHSHENQD